MSLVKTVAEVIADLKKLDKNAKVLYNIYTADDIRESVSSYVEDSDRLDGMTDDEVISQFNDKYDEENPYWEACSAMAQDIDEED